MGLAYWGTCFMNYVSWPIILLIMKYGDNLNASIARQQLILMRNIDEGFSACVAYVSVSELWIFTFCTVSYFFHACLTFFFPLSCVNTSRCSTGSATTKNCSCRVTQRSAWATNMPLTYRHSTITLPWIPWWVEGILWTVCLCMWVRKGPGCEAASSSESTMVLWEVK